MPTLLGEKMVIRILDQENLNVRLDELGIRPEALEVFHRALHKPHGLVLATGPTGSGKTTTLYSALDLLRGPGVNIVTVEDPVEYQLELINQIQVNEGIGMTFARALRSILRQDPDVIMIGEIRDEETARVAVQAALTGHLVLATLHTNDGAATIVRLQDMGVEPYLLASALNCVLAQRLARRVCAGCVKTYYPSQELLRDAGIPEYAGRTFKRGEGCPRCHDTGFEGRVGVYEMMEITPALRSLIYRGGNAEQIRARHVDAGGLLLRQEAVAHAISGLTSLEEAVSVTQLETFSLEDNPGDAGGPARREAA